MQKKSYICKFGTLLQQSAIFFDIQTFTKPKHLL